jgi:hypothetical protein
MLITARLPRQLAARSVYASSGQQLITVAPEAALQFQRASPVALFLATEIVDAISGRSLPRDASQEHAG